MKSSYVPGNEVPESGIYRVYHDRHRLMHVATLLGGSRFPRCKQCKDAVRFELVRRVKDSMVIPTTHHAILERWRARPRPIRAAS